MCGARRTIIDQGRIATRTTRTVPDRPGLDRTGRGWLGFCRVSPARLQVNLNERATRVIDHQLSRQSPRKTHPETDGSTALLTTGWITRRPAVPCSSKWPPSWPQLTALLNQPQIRNYIKNWPQKVESKNPTSISDMVLFYYYCQSFQIPLSDADWLSCRNCTVRTICVRRQYLDHYRLNVLRFCFDFVNWPFSLHYQHLCVRNFGAQIAGRLEMLSKLIIILLLLLLKQRHYHS